jgi:sulfate adenylyltransferase
MQQLTYADARCTLQEKGYTTADVAQKEGLHIMKLSGTKFRKMLRSGEEIPEWFAFKSVVEVLRQHAQHTQQPPKQ